MVAGLATCASIALSRSTWRSPRKSWRPKRPAIFGGVMGTEPATPHRLRPLSTSTAVANLALTDFMLMVTELREPRRFLESTPVAG